MDKSLTYKLLQNGVLHKGWRGTSDVAKLIHDELGAERVSAWFNKLYRTPSFEPNPAHMRLVNRFSIGADPEYAFISPRGDMAYATEHFGLNAGACFGADANCRLAELRAAPSRSALRVTASLLKAMRLLVYAVPSTCDYQWVAYPYIKRDGVGGHVHFGRRRVTRAVEVRALDNLADLLREVGVFDARGWTDRYRQTPYGRYGDVREQPFGYEYRTCPTCLGSPWQTFLVLTAAKLTTHSCVNFPTQNVSSLRTLLAVYKAFDDDALLAWKVLQREGPPVQTFSDFRSLWGLPMNRYKAPQATKFVAPFMAPASEEEVAELYTHLAKGVPLAFNPPTGLGDLQCALPDGYSLAVNTCPGAFQYGWAEVLRGAVVRQAMTVSTDTDTDLAIWHDRGAVWDRAVRSLADKSGIELETFRNPPGGGISIAADKSLRGGRGSVKLRSFLLSGLFPLWLAKEVNAGSYDAWQAQWRDRKRSMGNRKFNLETGGWERCAA